MGLVNPLYQQHTLSAAQEARLVLRNDVEILVTCITRYKLVRDLRSNSLKSLSYGTLYSSFNKHCHQL